MCAIDHEADRQHRRANFRAFTEVVGDCVGVRVLQPGGDDTTPFAAMVEFESADLAQQVVARLISERLYPSRLWPLEQPVLPGIPASHVDLSRRLYTFPLDLRYHTGDVRRAASGLRDAITRA